MSNSCHDSLTSSRRGVGSVVSANDDATGEPEGELGQDDEIGWLERVIPFSRISSSHI